MPKKKIIERLSQFEIEQLSLVGKMIVYDFMKDKFTLDEKREYLKMFEFFNVINLDEELMPKVYGGKYFDPDAKKGNAPTYADHIAFNPRTVPADSVVNFNDKMLQVYYDKDELNKPVEDMVKMGKKLSKAFGAYIREVKDPDQVQFLNAYKTILDDLTAGRHRKKSSDGMYYRYLYGMATTSLATSKPTMTLSAGQDGKIKYEYVNEEGADWQEFVKRLKGTGITESMNSAVRLQEAWDKAADCSLESREKLIRAYEDMLVDSEKIARMTQEKYNEVNRDQEVLQNNLDEFTDGSRSPKFVLDEAKLSIKLLKDGWLIDDIPALVNYYHVMMDAYRCMDGNNSEQNRQVYEKMHAGWEEAMNHVHGDATRTRMERLSKLNNHLKVLEKDIEKNGYQFTLLAKGEVGNKKNQIITTLINRMSERAFYQVKYRDTLALEKRLDPDSMYDALKESDPKTVSSSAQYKQLLANVKKLKGMNRKDDPEKYEIQVLRTLKSGEAYLNYKAEQMKEKGHKRSELEDERVKNANAVVSSIKRFNMDLLKEKSPEVTINIDKLTNADQQREAATKLSDASGAMAKGQKWMIDKLIAMKQKLISTQKPGKKGSVTNFENTDELQGSVTYRRMTQALQGAIDALQDKKSSPKEISESLKELVKECKTYQKEHDSMWSGNYLGKRTVRQAEAEKAIKDVPVMIAAFDHLRVQLAEFTDDNGNSYSHKPLEDADKKLADIKGKLAEAGVQAPVAKDMTDDVKTIRDIAEAQVAVRDALREKYPLMAENYEPYRSGAYYLALKDKPTVSDVAKIITVKTFMDQVYDKDAGIERIGELKEAITSGKIDAEAEKLSKDAVFKLMVKSFPRTCVEKWIENEEVADAIQEEYREKINEVLEEGKNREETNAPYANINEYFEWASHDSMSVSSLMLKELIASPKGKRIARILSICDDEERAEIFSDLQTIGCQYLNKTIDKLNASIGPNDTPEQERQKIANVLSSPKLKQGFMEKIFKSQENATREIDTLKRAPEMEQQGRVSRAPSVH
ncbi:hypothetical protein SAMN04487934_11369 [Eubacterium ruminantium]|nr:hypothetical protein SAMN04487934_11369 [Eubacterium ruminantium]